MKMALVGKPLGLRRRRHLPPPNVYSRSAVFLYAVATSLSRGSPCRAFVPLRPPNTLPRARSHRRHATVQQPGDYGTTSIDIDSHSIALTKEQRRAAREHRRRDLDGQSLVSDTLKEMEGDEELQKTIARQIKLGTAGVTAEERKMRRRALDGVLPPEMTFEKFVRTEAAAAPGAASGKMDTVLRRGVPEILQVNVGLYCNQACGHCHVESSPTRTEMMSDTVAARCVDMLGGVKTLDITGGAPELNASFRLLVACARAAHPDLQIIDRCNLTVLHEPGQEDLVQFLTDHRVSVIASLPCYSESNVDLQRGRGVFERSVSALLMLNEAGYGVPGSGLHLDLVYNPLGAFLPPEQQMLEDKYREELLDNFGIRFNSLFTMTNMPIKRFADFLHSRGELQEYMELLVRNFNLETVDSLMCTNTISVGHDGQIYDCDFNQQLGLAVGNGGVPGSRGKTVFDIERLEDLAGDGVSFDSHCFGCTAGMGSS